MTWAFDVTSNIPRITQSGTDTSLSGITTAINAVPTVARSTAYTTSQIVKPPTATGMWYRCSTAGTTSSTAPLYNPVAGGTVTDGTAVFTAFLAPDVRTLGTTNHYYMPDFRFNVTGTLTNANPQQENFTCWDLLLSAAGSNFTSGAWATDGVTPRWDGLHFVATRVSANNADNGSGGLQLQAGQFTFIGGEVQVAGAIGFSAGTTPRSYQTRWRNTKEWGASSSRIRAYTNTAIFRDCEFFDIAYDLFRMPAEFSVKARGSEYLAQYVGGQAGGADAKFTASNLENVDGTYDFDNYFSGWVELYNCKAGAALKVVTQYPNSTFWARHCVPLFQDIVITAKNTAGAAVQDVRFTATESPTNSPTVTISTVSNLKTWDFRTPLSYQTTTNASGVATSSPVLNVWYWESSFKQSLRFPASTAVYEGRAYGYKSTTVSVVLGASAAIPVAAGMIARDTATVLARAAALAQTGITFAASGATGGTVTISANKTLQQVWDYYNAWIIEFTNRPSNDTWTCAAGNMSMGAWNMSVAPGVTVSGEGNVTSFSTTGTVTNNGSITAIYSSGGQTSTILELRNIKPGASYIAMNNATKATILFGTNGEATAQDYPIYFPPGSTGTQIYVARKALGDFFDYEVITLEPGLIWHAFTDIPDEGAKETNATALNAYTELEANTKVYNYVTGIYMRTEEGMKLGEFFTREGTFLKWAAPYSVLIKQSASSLFSKSGNLFTIKASGLDADANYDTNVLTPPATMTADTNEVIGTEIIDANGDSSITIQGGSGNNEVWKVANGTPEDQYDTGTLLAATVGTGKWRFSGTTGFYLLVRDKVKNNRDTASMEKGSYDIGLYAGKEQITVAQLPEVYEIQDSLALMQIDIDNKPTLPQMEASTVLALRAQVEALGALINALPQAGQVVDANIVKVNNVPVDGTGSESDPWGPV